MPDEGYRPSRGDPLLIMAMDHRESFGRTLFGVGDDDPDAGQRAAMVAAKRLIYAGLRVPAPCSRAAGPGSWPTSDTAGRSLRRPARTA
jgi:hypothetical protein